MGVSGWTWVALVAVAVLSTATWASRCPTACRCEYDLQGRKTVACDTGEMNDPIPIFDMDRDTKVSAKELNYK